MIRILVIQGLLFLLPFALFAGYLVMIRGHRFSQGMVSIMPVARLTIAGLALVILGFIALATFGGGGPASVYTPAQFKDGVIIPGRID